MDLSSEDFVNQWNLLKEDDLVLVVEDGDKVSLSKKDSEIQLVCDKASDENIAAIITDAYFQVGDFIYQESFDEAMFLKKKCDIDSKENFLKKYISNLLNSGYYLEYITEPILRVKV